MQKMLKQLFELDYDVCVVCAIQEYLERTKSLTRYGRRKYAANSTREADKMKIHMWNKIAHTH